MQRRVEQPHRDRQPVHRLEDADEVGLLLRAELLERGVLLVRRCRRGSCAARSAAGRRGTCARCGTGRCPRRRTRAPCAASSGRSALVRTFSVRSSSAQPRIVPKWPVGSGVITGTSPTHDLAGRAGDRDHVALAARSIAAARRTALRPRDRSSTRFGAADRGLAHAARDDRRVRHEPAARREDALGRDHAVQVVGRRLGAHEDHALPRLVPRPRRRRR